MSRRVRRKGAQLKNKGKESLQCYLEIGDESLCIERKVEVDWINLPDDTVLQLFSCLNYRDRASLSSTCRTWRDLGSSPCLWDSLDIRAHKCDHTIAASLASRCSKLQKLRFRGGESANAIMHLHARDLREISGDFCRDIGDATLAVLAARHEALESLQLGPDFCEKISSDAIKLIAFCCPKLKILRLSGVRDVDSDAINSLAKHCKQLAEIGFIDCRNVNEVALGNVSSVRFLSLAGTRNLKWSSDSLLWKSSHNLIGIDVSRTDVSAAAILALLSSLPNLKLLCALNCPILEEEGDNLAYYKKGSLLLAIFNDIFKKVASLFVDSTKSGRNVFSDWRNMNNGNKNLNEIMTWLEWSLSHTLLRIAEGNPEGMDSFWIKQGAALLLSLMQSSQEDVQERAATGLATFVVIDDETATVDCGRAEVVMGDGGIPLLLNLARSCREGLQSEAAKAIANLSVHAKVAKAVAEEGGINILADLARSMNKLGTIAGAGGIKALVDLIFKWPSGGDGVLERAAGALANLAADDKCSMEVALAGGVHALVMLARSCKFEGVQEQAARALANLAAHGDNNSNNAAVGQEAGALAALVQLTRSHHEGVRQEAAGALWNLSFDDKNREAIAAAGGVEALVALAQNCANASQGLQERAAGALWGLSVSEANSIAIGQGGGVAPLIALAHSDAEDVHETAAGALWNLAFNPGNAFRIVEEGGVRALVRLCSSSISKMARFMAALALAYMFDGRMDEIALVGPSSECHSKSLRLEVDKRMALRNIEAFLLTFSDPESFAAAAASSAPAALAQVAEAARIQEAGHLRCSGSEIARFLSMVRNSSSILKACAAFALLQFTIPGGRHAMHHAKLMEIAGAARTLRASAAASVAPIEAKIFAKIVLRNLEHHKSLSITNQKLPFVSIS
ncbi:Arabidillo-like protein [Thalictrum thalictroides]|uniref:Arabidillo-like protein n=1 Tax=Thalictrum thalictroides TaxID=46969 RepID=A0A7J6W4Y9_THATH|nr:Arabidillo-like protein [Thalictrum thalictroides]